MTLLRGRRHPGPGPGATVDLPSRSRPIDALTPVPAEARLAWLINGYQYTQLIHVAAELGLADHLVDGPLDSDDLARRVEANPDAFARYARARAALGVLDEVALGRFALGPIGAWLRADHPQSLRPWARFVAQGHRRQTWGHLLQSVRTGENAFRAVLGVDSWTYRAQNPDQAALFNEAMTANSRRIEPAIVRACDLSGCRRVADLGGGQGSLLAGLLRAHPELQGVLFDLPAVVAGAGSILEAAGVADRCEVVGGSLFEGVPTTCDAYLMKFILHDWSDEDAARILAVCRRDLPASARLILVEYLVGPPNEGLGPKLSDLNMLLGPGGRERTEAEFGALLRRSGFRLIECRSTEAPVHLLVAQPE